MTILADNDVWLLQKNIESIATLELKASYQLLSATEQVRAGQFRFAKDQQRYTVAKSTLRKAIAQLRPNIDPQQIQFTQTANGKPILADPIRQPPLYFNISHSGAYVLVAITTLAPIGIDIECRQREMEYLSIAKRFFATSEYAKLRQLPPEELAQAFFHIWTCKEAIIKALGDGIAFGLQRFTVSADPTQKAQLIQMADHHPDDFFMHAWSVDAAHQAALALHTPLQPNIHTTYP